MMVPGFCILMLIAATIRHYSAFTIACPQIMDGYIGIPATSVNRDQVVETQRFA